MRFSTTFAIFSALAAAAQAVNFTVLTFATVTGGQPFDLTWTGAKGPVTLTLKNGPPTNLQTVSTIASGLSGNSYTWQVPQSLINLETYALEISDGTDTNYSTQFQLIGGTTTTSGSASQSSTGTASQTGSVTSSASLTSITSTESLTSVVTESSGTSTGVRTTSAVITRSTTTSASAATSTPPSGAASGLSSNVALVLLAAGALFMIN